MNENATETDNVIRHEFKARLDRNEAITALNTAIIRFMNEAEAFNEIRSQQADDEEPEQAPVHVIKAEAGIGKSTGVITAIKKALRKNPNARILYMVPSLELGEELATKAKAQGIPARVMRGRSQPKPGAIDRKDTMCAKAEIAETLSALSISVSDTLCRKRKENGELAECKYAANCPYLAQMQEAKQGGLIIASHQYLSVRMDALKDIDLLIVDESYWQVLTMDKRIDLGRFTTWRSVGEGFRAKKGEGRRFVERRDEASFELGEGVEIFELIVKEAAPGQPTLAAFRAKGITPEFCDHLATLEYSRIKKPDIDPGMSYEEQKDRVEKAEAQEAFSFARVWKILGAELATGREAEPHGIVIERGVLNPKSGELGNYVHAFWSRDPRIKNVPTLLIDADADEEITERFFPGAEITEIAAKWRNVEIVQAFDKSGSAYSFKNSSRRRDEVYNAALDMADRLADVIDGKPERRPLLVSQKSVIDGYREAGDLEGAPFDTAHFGNLRGKDGWKEAAGIVVAGRIEPSPQGIETMQRGIWYKSEEQLTFLVPLDTGALMLPHHVMTVDSKDGDERTISVSRHPDRRGHRVLVQIREAELMQAIARIRPIHRSAEVPCQIIVLSNVPLPIQPDRFYKWSQIVPDRFDLPRLAGIVFETAQDIADAFPDLFKSAGSVWTAASRREERAFPGFDGRAATLQNSSINNMGSVRRWVRATFNRQDSGNRVAKVWLAVQAGDDADSLKARVLEFLPDAYDIDLSMPATVAQEAAQMPRDKATGIKFIRAAMLVMSQMVGSEPPIFTAFPPARSYFQERRLC